MAYSQELIEEIRSRNDIVDVISGYVHLTKKGANHMGLCPFHNEKSPSFSVSGGKQMYHCFGCGVGGDVFKFLMDYDNLTFMEAVQQLAERAGIKLPDVDDSPQARQARDHRSLLFEVNKEAAIYFYRQLRSQKGEHGYAYFRERQLTEETMKHFGLGYANVTSNDLVLYLRSKGYRDDLIVEAGLASHDEKHGTHDKFWNRVMFPIQDAGQKVIGFGGRVMGEGKPKYLNSPETPIFDKSRNLYGLNYAKNARKGRLILCEGYMDVIAMHQAGFTEAVASLGTAFTTGQASILKRYADEVILSYDSDEAGTKAAMRAIGILKEAGLRGKVLHLEPYKDPDEFIKAEGAEAFEQRLRDAENTFFFEIGVMRRGYDMSDPAAKTEFDRALARRLAQIPEQLERENYLSAVCARFHIPADALKELVRSYAAEGLALGNTGQTQSLPRRKAAAEDGILKSQRVLLTWIADEPRIWPKIKAYIRAEDFGDPLYRKVAERMFTDLDQGHFLAASVLSEFPEQADQEKVSEIFNTNLVHIETNSERETAIHDVILAIRRASYQRSIDELPPGAPDVLKRTVEGKKALEALARTRIALD